MREIKFRAWDGAKVIMPETTEDVGSSSQIYVTYFFGRVSLINQFGLDNKPVDVLPNIILMQYTGLKDSLGIEIFEGDIIETPMGNIIEVLWGEKVYYTGKHEYQCFGWIARNKKGKTETLDTSMTAGIVVGNIYKNPDLIKP